MAKKSAKRFYKRSYDSDRNSYSGEQGLYRRNSSESLNAAMRSIVQRNERRIQYTCGRARVDEEDEEEEDDDEDEEDDVDVSDMQDHIYPSVLAGSVKTCPDDQAGIEMDTLMGVHDKMATSSIKRLATKSLTTIISARNSRMESNKVIPLGAVVAETQEAKL